MHDSQADAISEPVVALTAPLPGLADLAYAAGLTSHLRVLDRTSEKPTRQDLLRFVRGASVIVCVFTDSVDAELLEAAGPQLKGVCAYAVGIDNIDLSACAARGVTVCNTPDAVTPGTANLVWALILACTRRLIAADRFVRSGRFAIEGNGFPDGWMGLHLDGQTLCIVGAGRIGLAVAHRAVSFGMKVVYVARSNHPDFEIGPVNARRVTLEQGLAGADVVSIHTPLTPGTRGMIGPRQIALLKPTAVVINTARGPVVDEAALADALRRNAIWGAGLDVFEREPHVHPDLLTLDNVVLTPHIGSAEGLWRRKMTQMVLENAAAMLNGQAPPNALQT